jgi:hypothetical protein
MKKIAVVGALIGAIAAAPIGAQTATPALKIPDMSSATPTYGQWTFVATAGGGEARFVDSSARPQLILTCNRAGRSVTIARRAGSAAPYLQVWSSSESRNILSAYNPATQLLSAPVQAYDRLLDAMAQSRGRIAIGIFGQPMLVVPAWAEIGRVVEECRP